MKPAKIFCAIIKVNAATEEQFASIDEVASASKKLAELADELTASTSKFKI